MGRKGDGSHTALGSFSKMPQGHYLHTGQPGSSEELRHKLDISDGIDDKTLCFEPQRLLTTFTNTQFKHRERERERERERDSDTQV